MKHKQYLFLIPALLSCQITHSMVPVPVVPRPVLPARLPAGLPGGGSQAALPAQAALQTVKISPETLRAVTGYLQPVRAQKLNRGFQQVAQMDPEVIATMKYYQQMGQQALAQQTAEYIVQQAKILNEAPSTTSPIQEAMNKNSQLSKLMTQEIPETLTSGTQTLAKIAYTPSTRFPTFHSTQNNFHMVERQVKNLFTDSVLSPQKAAGEISEILTGSLRTLLDQAEQLAHEAANSPFAQDTQSLVNDIGKLRDDLTRTKGFLQGSVSASTPTLTNQQIENIVKNIKFDSIPEAKPIVPEVAHQPTAVQRAVTTSNQALQVAMQNNVQEFKGNIATTKTKSTQLIQQIQSLPDLTTEQKFAVQKAGPMIDKQIASLQQVFTSLAQHTDTRTALLAYTQHAPGIVRMIENVSLILTTLINSLTPAQQQRILPLIQALDEFLTDANHFANMMQIIAREILSESSSLQEIKKVMDKVALHNKVDDTITIMQSALNEIQQLAQETGLETDKASPTMLQVIHSALQERISDIAELKQANNIQELEEKISALKAQNPKIAQYLEALSSKIDALRVSPEQKRLLQLVQQMIKDFKITEEFINTIEQKMSEVDEEHIWIDIAKTTITQGITRYQRDGKTLVFFLQQHIDKADMTPEQLQAYKDLVAQIQKFKTIEDEAFRMTNIQDLARLAHQLDPANASKLLSPSSSYQQYAQNIAQIKQLLQMSNLGKPHEQIPFLLSAGKKFDETLEKAKVVFGMLLGAALVGGGVMLADDQDLPDNSAEQLLMLAGDLPLLDRATRTTKSPLQEQQESNIIENALEKNMQNIINSNNNIAQASPSRMQAIMDKTMATFRNIQNPQWRKEFLNALLIRIQEAFKSLQEQSKQRYGRFLTVKNQRLDQLKKQKDSLLNKYRQWAQEQQRHADEIIALASK